MATFMPLFTSGEHITTHLIAVIVDRSKIFVARTIEIVTELSNR